MPPAVSTVSAVATQPGDVAATDATTAPGVPPALPSGDAVADGPVRKWGYITQPDGNRMRYSLSLPKGNGKFPLLVIYDGYGSGTSPGDVIQPWVAEGYAVMGLNGPGTGCSTGEDRVYHPGVGVAGAFAIEWAATQPWSNGRVGMIGYSYSGYNQLWVAAQRPKGLLAITPSKTVGDPYRDVGYPGGIRNVGFPVLWWGAFPGTWKLAAAAAAKLDGDTGCAETVAENIEKIHRPDLDLLKLLANPYADDFYTERSVYLRTASIDIPVLGSQSWQDEMVGARTGYYEDTIAPEKMWLLPSNGDHHTTLTSGDIDATMKRFLAHFVKGEDNGFEREPHVALLQEMQQTGEKSAYSGPKLEPRAVARFDRLPLPVKPMRLWMQPGGGLGDVAPGGASSSSSYSYPAASPGVNNPGAEGWDATASTDGQVAFTTAALPEDLSFYGEGSADLWLSASATDTDLQVTVSEVRPDGKEMFVQRGWLRASKRALDLGRSTTLRPWQLFTREAAAPLVPDEPMPVRVEIQKFAHVFRAGSAIRVTIDSPSQTGLWVFDKIATPSTNRIWHDSTRRSSIVLGHLPYPHADGLPDCGKTLRQPCRANAIAVPAGQGPRPPA